MGRSLAFLFALAAAAPVLLLPARRPRRRLFRPALCRCTSICAGKGRPRRAGPNARSGFRRAAPLPPTRRAISRIFAQGRRSRRGATMVLDSDGGSVHGAIALGREIRRLKLNTTVGRIVDLAGADENIARARLSPRANCESMCAFVLLGGVQRSVPPRGARDGAPDLAWRPPRRSDRGDLLGRGPGAGAARYRAAGEIYHRYGRLDRTARSRAADSAVGADARFDARGNAPHADRDRSVGAGHGGCDGGRCAAGGRAMPLAQRSAARSAPPKSASAAGRWSIAPDGGFGAASSAHRRGRRKSAASISCLPAAPPAAAIVCCELCRAAP